MITKPSISALKILKIAQKALKRGDKKEARYWARQAVVLLPEKEEPWLIFGTYIT